MLIESIPGEPLSFHVIPFDNPRLQYTLQVRQYLYMIINYYIFSINIFNKYDIFIFIRQEIWNKRENGLFK